MSKIERRLTIIILLLTVAIVGALSKNNQDLSANKLYIVCTTTMIYDTVNQIAGNQAYVVGLMGPGVDPHLYRATESDVYALSRADLIFYNGLHLEGKMAEVLEHMNNYVPTVALGSAISKDKLIPSDFDDIYDPHIWHDVSLWMCVVEKIKNSLIHHDSQNAVSYEKNAQRYLQELIQLDQFVQEQAQRVFSNVIITAHDAFAYFGKRYGFKVVGLQGISTDAQVCTKDIQDITEVIVEEKIRAIFLESSIPSRNIQAVQQAVAARGWHVTIAPELFSDALSDQSTTADTYHGMIKHNIKTIVDSLTH